MNYASLVILFFLLQSAGLFSQENSLKTIDAYLERAQDAKSNNDDLAFLKYSKKANQLALRSRNSERIARSYYYMAFALYLLEIRKESLMYIQKAMQQPFVKDDKALQTRLYELKGMNYIALNLYDNALEENNRIINLIKPSESNAELVETLSSAYSSKGILYHLKTDELDSVRKYSKLEIDLLESNPEGSVFQSLSQAYLNKASLLGLSKQNDSALFYIKKAFTIRQKYEPELISYDLNFALAEYYYNIYDNKKALEYYLKGFNEIKKLGIKDYSYSDVYKNISELYGLLGDPDKEKEFLKLYVNETERIQKQHKDNTHYALKIINEEKEQELSLFKNRIYMILAGLMLAAALLLFFLSGKRKKEKKLLQQKQDMILIKEEENQQLQQKVNDSFNDVIQLAKTNSPEFWARFQEVYPYFRNRMLAVNPDLKQTELILCAYIYLGFTAKDIADYTFKALKTIKNNKYNLRKRLDIPTKDDLVIWIRNQVDA